MEYDIKTEKRLNEMPRGSYVQGYDGFKHAKVGDDLWLLCVTQEVSPHDVKSIELPAASLYVPFFL